MQENATMKLFALNSNQPLARKIAAELAVSLCDASVKHFSDGEIQININESVRGDDVFVIQSIADPVNENFMELMIMIDALKRASAGTINVVIPYYGYARADRKTRSREPITAKLIANYLQLAGANRVITLDLHAGQIQGFFNIPVDHLTALYDKVAYYQDKEIDKNLVVVAPNHDGVKGARNLAELLKAPIAIVDKRGKGRIDPETTAIIGDVSGRTCLITDDMIDTGAKMIDAARTLKAHGATSIYGCATHAVLSGNAVQELAAAPFEEILVTDTIAIPEEKRLSNMHVLSVAPTMAKALRLIYNNKSVDSLFNR